MNDQIISDEEKEALLDGMSTGEIEIHSKRGPQYAEVKNFVIGPRSRIITNSFPRLQQLNQQLAGHMSKFSELLLNVETIVKANPVETCTYSDFCSRVGGLYLAVEFEAKPLKGPGLIFLNSTIIGYLVESFFGGSESDPVRRNPDFFSPGETIVASLFCDGLLTTLADVWKPIIALDPAKTSMHVSSTAIENIDASDTVMCTEFSVLLAEQQEAFQVVWPNSTVTSLLPVFEGKKRERDQQEDARWERALRTTITDSTVSISSSVGHAEMRLRDVAEWAPGVVIGISNPRMCTVSAEQVPVLEGRFGVHDGSYAVEAVSWLEPGKNIQATKN